MICDRGEVWYKRIEIITVECNEQSKNIMNHTVYYITENVKRSAGCSSHTRVGVQIGVHVFIPGVLSTTGDHWHVDTRQSSCVAAQTGSEMLV